MKAIMTGNEEAHGKAALYLLQLILEHPAQKYLRICLSINRIYIRSGLQTRKLP